MQRSGRSRIDRSLDDGQIAKQNFEALGSQGHDSQSASRHILLLREVLVSSHEDIKRCILGSPEKNAVFEAIPPQIANGKDVMSRDVMSQIVR